MGEARAVCQSVNLLLCTPINSHFFVPERNSTFVIIIIVSKFLSSLYCVYAFCIALMAVDPLQDSEVSDPFVLKWKYGSEVNALLIQHPSLEVWFGLFSEIVWFFFFSWYIQSRILWPWMYDVLWLVVIKQYIDQLAIIWTFWDNQHWPLESLLASFQCQFQNLLTTFLMNNLN